MNCSQLLERRTATNWERPAEVDRNLSERPELRTSETYLWSASRFSSVGQMVATRFVPSLKVSH